MGKRGWPAWLICLFLLLLALSSTVGCGKSEPAEEAGGIEEVAEEGERDTAEETEVKSPAGEAEEPAGTEATEEEAPAEAEEPAYSLEQQAVGTGQYADLTIWDVRWSDQGDYYRFVFEIRRSDGTNTENLPHSATYYSGDNRRLFFFVLAVNVSDEEFEDLDDSVFLGHLPVSRISRIMGGSSMETTFVLECIEPLRHWLHYETDPMRVILDVEKP